MDKLDGKIEYLNLEFKCTKNICLGNLYLIRSITLYSRAGQGSGVK